MNRKFKVYGSIGLLVAGAYLLVASWSGQTPNKDGSAPESTVKTKQPTALHTPEPVKYAKIINHNPSKSLSAPTTSTSKLAAQPKQVQNSRPVLKQQWGALVRDSIDQGDPRQRHQEFGKILRKMQGPDFTSEDALAIRGAMKKHGMNQAFFNRFDRAWAANQPEAAVAYLDKLSEGEREPFLKGMIPGLASESPQMAIELFESMEPKVQARIRPKFLEGLIDNSLEVATEYLYESTDSKNFNWRPMDELARELVKDQGLASTLQWADSLPEGPLRNSAWSAAYAVWESKDAHAAVQSIMELPKGMDRNLAINGLVSAHAHKDGERAVEWASEITNPHIRKAALIRVGRQYYKQNPLAATEWFDNSGLPQTAWDQVTSGQ